MVQFESTLATTLGYPTPGLAAQLNSAYVAAVADAAKKQAADQTLAATGTLLKVQKTVDTAKKSASDIRNSAVAKLNTLANPADPQAAVIRANAIEALRSLGQSLNTAAIQSGLGEVRIISAQ
jgi:hypothetical protein